MKVILEPNQQIASLWDKPYEMRQKKYRLIHYVLRVDYGGIILLHNVVTGQLVALEPDEIRILNCLPMCFSDSMKQLVDSHFLVPDDYDEHQQVRNMRRILRIISEKYQKSGILHYTILPTTGCNARCFYCYEQGIKLDTMTENTANDVVEFIAKHCEGKTISIRWFGGEPTLAVNRIEQICRGLHEKSIEFESRMTTNGFLLNEELILHCKHNWNLQSVMISLDGTEENYNRIKS